MSVLARLGRGFVAFVLTTLGSGMSIAGYWEGGGIHGGAEAARRLAQPSVYWALMGAGPIFCAVAIAILGSRWAYRLIAVPLVFVGPVVGMIALLNKNGPNPAIAAGGSFSAVTGLGMLILGATLSGPQRAR